MGWDRGVDFDAEKARIIEAITTTRNRVEKAFYAIALVQLTNGTRRNEALNACFKWLEEGKREVRIRAQKRKDKYMRLVGIDPILYKYDSIKKGIADIQAMARPHDAYYYFCKSRLGHNTHCMRYAFISDVSNKDKHPAEFIAKMTGQKDSKVVVRYIQQKGAEDALRRRLGLN